MEQTKQQIKYGRFTIEVVPIAEIDYLEKNARFMRSEQFKRLVANVKEDGQLSQIPFCVKRATGRYTVLSGNHRVKAAEKAELLEVPIIWIDESEITRDKELAIQLSHNAIAGEDDPLILQQLWGELTDVKLKMYSGLDDKSLKLLAKVPMPSLADVRLDFRTISFMFLPEEIGKVREAFKNAKTLVKGDETILARFSSYDKLLDTLGEVGASHNVTNGATGMLILLELLERHRTDLADGWFDPERSEARFKGWVPISTIVGNAKMPSDAAGVLKQAVDRMVEREEVEPGALWQALERLAADYLAGA